MAVSVPKGEFVQKLIPAGAPVNFLLNDLGEGADRRRAGRRARHPRPLEDPRRRGRRARARDRSEVRRGGTADARDVGDHQGHPAEAEGHRRRDRVSREAGNAGAPRGGRLPAPRRRRRRAREAGGEEGQTIDVGQFKDLFGISRKVAIPLLEFFDRKAPRNESATRGRCCDAHVPAALRQHDDASARAMRSSTSRCVEHVDAFERSRSSARRCVGQVAFARPRIDCVRGRARRSLAARGGPRRRPRRARTGVTSAHSRVAKLVRPSPHGDGGTRRSGVRRARDAALATVRPSSTSGRCGTTRDRLVDASSSSTAVDSADQSFLRAPSPSPGSVAPSLTSLYSFGIASRLSGTSRCDDRDHRALDDQLRLAERHRRRDRASGKPRVDSERLVDRAHHRRERRRLRLARVHHREETARDRRMLREPQLAFVRARLDRHLLARSRRAIARRSDERSNVARGIVRRERGARSPRCAARRSTTAARCGSSSPRRRRT